ncbi:early growth response protein 1-A-like [Neocloeon triangulifer]|uniref:early growth response protein 1-A-like n=1 Tax=Neocloeon triangulifer TaxID=2078957 RepID=UPI00286F941D|nr:early growth response protein 1-A-like [Neocloeon triangulifer]XP_059475261.1 early growth response protein 1-A-like [Neocloeon triangulifer]
MAETAVTSALHLNNNSPNATNNNPVNFKSGKHKLKRKCLNQVVDKLSKVGKPSPPHSPTNNNNNYRPNNYKKLNLLNHDEDLVRSHMYQELIKKEKLIMMAPSSADKKHETPASKIRSPPRKNEIFRFDSVDRERYSQGQCGRIDEEEPLEDVFSPASSTKTPSLAVKEEPVDSKHHLHRYPGCACAHCTPLEISPMDRFFPLGLSGIPASPVSPLAPCTPGGNLPITPSPIYNLEYLHSKYLLSSEYSKRRSHSDSDIPLWFEGASLAISLGAEHTAGTTTLSTSSSGARKQHRHHRTAKPPLKGGSLESESSQDSPLDLSVRGSSRSISTSSSESVFLSRLRGQQAPPTPPTPPQSASTAGSPSPLAPTTPTPPPATPTPTATYLPRSLVPVPVVRGDVASPTTKESVAVRYNLEVSPVVEEMPPGSDVAYVCPICGQMFSLHDRLAKHMASRHKSKQQSEQTTKAYLCEVCQRSFARSDMLTRHMRLHTGIKPYTCRVCGQVFSRSDHLSTHQRTHTGEKPYRCPQCPYAACRRDMITRHMRTHARYETGGGPPPSVLPDGTNSSVSGGSPAPLSPSLALSSLSVHSPSPASPPEPMDND